MRTAALIAFVFVLAFAALIPACNRTPTRPSFLAPSPAPPPGPAPVGVTRLELSAPASVAPGASVQFTATAQMSDGTTRDVTTTAVWRSVNAAVLTLTATGLATGGARGESFVQVTTSGRSAGKSVIVVPDGTFRMVGRVGEADSPTTPVPGATVEAIGGSAPSAVTSDLGNYRLYGVLPNSQIRITKDGYQPQMQSVAISDHQTQNFVLTLAAPRANLSGTHTVTISASDRCRASLPEEARARTYNAVLTQQGPILEATLTNETLIIRNGNGNRFRGRLEPNRVVFTLNAEDGYSYYYEIPQIVEQIGASLYLTVNGSAVLAGALPRFSGSLNGALSAYQADPRTGRPLVSGLCRAPDHQFVLSR